MPFLDPAFLFYFLPLALFSLRLAGRRAPTPLYMVLMVVLTLAFYGYERVAWVVVFVVIALSTYIASHTLSSAERKRVRLAALVLGLVLPLAFLFAFKYLNWIASYLESLKPLQGLVAGAIGESETVLLPPGISFYTFEALSVVIDSYRRKYKLSNPLSYLSFLACFPRFIAGPIVRYDEIERQYKVWQPSALSNGLTIFSIGMSLKVFGADSAAEFVPYAFATASPALVPAWLGTIAFSVQIYLDFWGYSLMALGIGLAIGVRFPENFRLPYRSSSVSEFWRRWHITLGTWLRDYVYISFGGGLGPRWRAAVNLFLTMLIGGLWHGANLTFVAWGALHGVVLAIERIANVSRSTTRSPARIALTCLIVFVGWVLFKAESIEQAFQVYRGLLGLNGIMGSATFDLPGSQTLPAALFLGALAFIAFGEKRLVFPYPLWEHEFTNRARWTAIVAFVIATTMALSATSIPFLYFQF